VLFALAARRALATSFPRVRFGVNAGEVFMVNDDVHGAAVNAAAQIAGRAAGGEVLVSDVVRQLVGHVPGICVSDRGRCHLKGFAERWHLWAASDQASRPHEHPTVGRVDELAAIGHFLARLTAGDGGSMLLEGEAGIGKSHLLDDAIARAGAVGIDVIAIAIDEVVRRPGAIAYEVLRAATTGHPTRTRLEALLSRMPDLGNDDRGFAVIEASIDLVEEMSLDAPVLLAVEDLHWSDELSLAVLIALTRRAPVSSYGLIGTLRPTPRRTTLDRLLDLMHSNGGSHLTLAPLDDLAASALASLLTGAATGDGLRSRLGGAAGNPLYITELIRSLDDDGLLHVQSGIADADAGSSTATLHETLVRRLSWLPPETSELLRLASLLGGAFTLHDLAAITGLTVVEVAARLREATLAGLVVGNGARLGFRHDLIREAVYEHMQPAERRDLHRAAGHALSRAGASTQLIAEQYSRGALVGDLDAVHWLEMAAHEVIAIAPNDAVSLLETAVTLAPGDSTHRLRLQAQLIEPLALCDRYDDAEQLAATVLAAEPDPGVEFEVLRNLPLVHGGRGQANEEIAAFRQAAAAPGASPTDARRLQCFAAQVSMLHGTTPTGEATEIAERMLAEATGDDDVATRCAAHQTLGVAAFVTGHLNVARHHLDTAMALFQSRLLADAVYYMTPDRWHALCLLESDEIDEAKVAAAEALRRAEHLGTRARLASPYMIAAMADYATGRWDDALTILETGTAVIAETGNDNFVLYFDALNALIALQLGDLERARKHVRDGIEHFRGGRAYFGADWLFGAHADVLAVSGDIEGALEVAAITWDRTQHVRFTYGCRHRGISLVKLAVAAGRADLAEQVTSDLEEGRRRAPVASAAGAALIARAHVERNPDQALEAVACYRSTPLHPTLATTCEAAAELMVAAGRTTDAVALLQEAATIHAKTENSTALARVDAALRRLGTRRTARRTSRPTSGWESLTTMERNVSRLVADGLTNPDIGTRLYISRRTVETHLSHVYTKLGLTGRTQLVAELVKRESTDEGADG
jgi:DNA-binding CsgD family transcriptional regulator